MTLDAASPRRVLVTGAEGYLGRLFVEALAADPGLALVATDVRVPKTKVEKVTHLPLDITDADAVRRAFEEHRPEVVVHLAAVVTPRPGQSREEQRKVDVDGTKHVLEACVATGVRKVITTSSGAAYGYHADNHALLVETDPLRGNEVFAYSWHKRLVEQLLADYRERHPELHQLVFRVSTVLGERVHNQITALFEGRVIVGLRGVDTPFCFVWDQDVVACLAKGVRDDAVVGVFNLTGDGVMTLREIARAMKRRFLPLPARWLGKGLAVLSKRGVVPYGPEQVLFLAHRPVLSNAKLKRELGFPPRSSREVFGLYRASRAFRASYSETSSTFSTFARSLL